MGTNQNVAAVSAFIEGAPPGELIDVVNDIRAIATEDPSIIDKAQPAFEKYAEEQLAVASLPNQRQKVLISSHNRIGNGEYYDVAAQVSYTYDPVKQAITNEKPYSSSSQHIDTISSLHKSFSMHAAEHYPISTISVVPSSSSPDTIALLLVANRYSPSNFWSGRLRTIYTYNPSSQSLSGVIKVDVHYYEDGNVRLTTSKQVANTTVAGGSAAAVVREIAKVERKYHEDLNRGFTQLNEGAFKALRRPLPVTRQKMEWEKVSSYRAGRDIGGLKR